jgi:hypothetical protein
MSLDRKVSECLDSGNARVDLEVDIYCTISDLYCPFQVKPSKGEIIQLKYCGRRGIFRDLLSWSPKNYDGD